MPHEVDVGRSFRDLPQMNPEDLKDSGVAALLTSLQWCWIKMLGEFLSPHKAELLNLGLRHLLFLEVSPLSTSWELLLALVSEVKFSLVPVQNREGQMCTELLWMQLIVSCQRQVRLQEWDTPNTQWRNQIKKM